MYQLNKMGVVVKETLQGVIYVYLLIATLSIPPSRAGDNSLIPNGTVCTCSGAEVIYECSVCSGATTLWSGTTLDCVTNGIITLRHNSDNFQPGTFDYCNGEITSEIVGIKGNCYISRVNFTTMARFNNTSIDCSLQDPIRSSIGNSTIFIPGSDYLSEPSGFMVSSVNMTGISISWTENSLCSESISYSVGSNCSSVRCATTRNEATCSNLPIAIICSFGISSAICRRMETIAVNNAITVTLRHPQANITPVYSPGSPSTLTKVIITIYPEPFLSIAGDGPSPVIGYSFSYSNVNVNVPACQDHEVMCQRSIDVTCPPSAEIDVTLSASNMLGQGPATDPATIGCTNEFVHVKYDSGTSTITCNFLDETDTSIKSCALRQCDQVLASSFGQNSTVEAPNSITLNVVTEDSDCYVVTASSYNSRITVEIRTPVGTGNPNTGAVIGISIGIIIGVIVLVVMIIVATVVIKFKGKKTTERLYDANVCDDQPLWNEINLKNDRFEMLVQVESSEKPPPEIISQFGLQEIPVDGIRLIEVLKDSQLKEFTEDIKSKLNVGRSFYEYQGEFEDLPKQSKVIFMDEIACTKFFASNITSLKEKRRFRDRRTNWRELLKGFKIFVESFKCDESLKQGAYVIYEVPKIVSNIEDESSTANTTANIIESAAESNTKDDTETTHV